MTCTRRQTLNGLLGGFGLAGLSSVACKPSSGPGPSGGLDSTMTQAVFDEQALRAPLQRLLADSPWAGIDFAGELGRGIEELIDAGMEDTAQLLTKLSNRALTGGLGIAEADPEEPLSMMGSMATAIDGFVEVQEDIVRLAATMAIELKAANGDVDEVPASQLTPTLAKFEEHETTLRAWLYDQGAEGDAGRNATLALMARWRQDATRDQSIDDACDTLGDAAAEFGTFATAWTDLLPDIERAENPPPPVDWDAACEVLGYLGLLLAPYGGTSGLAKETPLSEMLDNIADTVRDEGVASAASMFDACSAFGQAVQLLQQSIAMIMACVTVGMVLAAFMSLAAWTWLIVLFFVVDLIIAIANVACSVKALIDLGIDAKECP